MEDKEKPASGAALDDGALDGVAGGGGMPDPFAEKEKMLSQLTMDYYCEKCKTTYKVKFTEFTKFRDEHIAAHNTPAVGGKN